jgi:hypothetical protein
VSGLPPVPGGQLGGAGSDGASPGGTRPGGAGPDAGRSDPGTAETYLRLVAEAELRQRRVISGPGPHQRRDRVWLAAVTLAAAGAVSPDVAWKVVSDVESATGLRSGNLRPAISTFHRPHWVRQHGASQHAASQDGASQETGGPDVPIAVQVGATLPLPVEPEGWYGEFRLLSLARTDSQAALAVAARWVGQTRRGAGSQPRHVPFHEVGAIDDQGISYRASLWDMGLEDGRDWWDCHLGLDPALAPGTRWLEIGPGAQGRSVRIDLSAPPGPAEVIIEPVPPVSAAARMLDRAGDDLLCVDSVGSRTAPLASRVALIIRDLIGSGALQPDDPSVVRLAGLGWRLGLDLGLGGPVPARALPPAWLSVLADGHAHDGPDGIAAFAADLPEIGGSRFALAGLRSTSDEAVVHVMACGWEPQGREWLTCSTGLTPDPLDTTLSWQARDSSGRWHLVNSMSYGSASQTNGMIKMYLTPPLHPGATSLDVILSGPGCRVQATVPLDWGSRR